jgi:hypothetical protein
LAVAVLVEQQVVLVAVKVQQVAILYFHQSLLLAVAAVAAVMFNLLAETVAQAVVVGVMALTQVELVQQDKVIMALRVIIQAVALLAVAVAVLVQQVLQALVAQELHHLIQEVL